MDTTIGRMADIDLRGLQGTVGDVLSSAQKIASSMAGAQGTQGAAEETVNAAADAAKDVFKNLFGSGK